MYFSYFDDLPLNDMEFVSRPGRMFYSWATNDGQTVAGMCCRYEDFGVLRMDPEKIFMPSWRNFHLICTSGSAPQSGRPSGVSDRRQASAERLTALAGRSSAMPG